MFHKNTVQPSPLPLITGVTFPPQTNNIFLTTTEMSPESALMFIFYQPSVHDDMCISKIDNSFTGDSVVKNPPANAGDASSIPGSAGEGSSNPLQCSLLGNPMDREAWWAVVHGVTKSWT